MKKVKMGLAGLCLFLSASIISCKKESESSKIEGSWTLNEVGADLNHDNVVDQGETRTTTQENIAATLTLRSDNTYTYVFVDDTSTGSQTTDNGTFAYNNSMLLLINGTQTDSLAVNTLSSNKLILKQSNNSVEWWIFSK